MNNTGLFKAAVNAMESSYAPYSHFKVGAALLCADGTVFKGCNIENASYPVTCCAERTALFSAVASGKRYFNAIAVVGGKDGEITDYAMPCGICRQALSEFCNGDFKIIVGKNENDLKEYTLSELLPCSFDKTALSGDKY